MLCIGNGRVITRDGAAPYIERGAVVVGDDGLIAAVGEEQSIRARYPDADFLDARGGLIMPGLINAHDHIYSAFARGMSIKNSNPKGFLALLDELWWTLDRHLLLPDTQASADAIMIECIENGVTTVFDHHASYGEIPGSLFAIAERAEQYGVRACLCYEVSDRDGEVKMREGVRENVEFINYARGRDDDALAGVMGMHAQFTLSDRTLGYCAEQNPTGAGYHIHVAEGIEDVRLCLREHGKRPTFRLHDFGLLGKKTICGHCTHVNEAEMNLIASTDSAVVHNPESNMGNAVGCPPVLRLFEKRVLIGLGTDGYTSDMLESYKAANALHKHNLCDNTAAWTEIPAMLFDKNRALAGRFFKQPVGVLKPGAHGDVIVVDYTPYTPMTENNLNSHLLFGVNGRMVRHTVTDGRVRMRDRELVGVDREAVLAHCREDARALWGRINENR